MYVLLPKFLSFLYYRIFSVKLKICYYLSAVVAYLNSMQKIRLENQKECFESVWIQEAWGLGYLNILYRIYDLLNDIVSSSDNIAPNGGIT